MAQMQCVADLVESPSQQTFQRFPQVMVGTSQMSQTERCTFCVLTRARLISRSKMLFPFRSTCRKPEYVLLIHGIHRTHRNYRFFEPRSTLSKALQPSHINWSQHDQLKTVSRIPGNLSSNIKPKTIDPPFEFHPKQFPVRDELSSATPKVSHLKRVQLFMRSFGEQTGPLHWNTITDDSRNSQNGGSEKFSAVFTKFLSVTNAEIIRAMLWDSGSKFALALWLKPVQGKASCTWSFRNSTIKQTTFVM